MPKIYPESHSLTGLKSQSTEFRLPEWLQVMGKFSDKRESHKRETPKSVLKLKFSADP